MKNFSTQALDFDRSVCMPAICYSDPISADISKTERLVRVYTDRRS